MCGVVSCYVMWHGGYIVYIVVSRDGRIWVWGHGGMGMGAWVLDAAAISKEAIQELFAFVLFLFPNSPE